MGWAIGVLGFDSQRGLGIFLFTTASRMALGPSQPPIQWVPGALSLGVKRPGREADHSPPSSAEIKERLELYLHSPSTPSWRGAQLKHRNNFTFYLYQMFLTVFTKARHWSLSWDRCIQSTLSHPTYLTSILILSSHLSPQHPIHRVVGGSFLGVTETGT
jgi:hypothetical protein